ncbi:helix-turn-helix domain-containing protein [Maribrevibacterium harenarium]|uniref:Helix-turn-helix domain-containing protein n=1 Tax=Maribrevibacterium harenarium TaxID=2589817 RepID=A0A501X471_9GAMM|nr:helix-turn-helix domain-containing protein [Maribrevibacterium harenarium]TPE55340.1 helix-turn-helix domain-containing protein [Maribrevibacterium harenarium]
MLVKIPSCTLTVEHFEADLHEICGAFQIEPRSHTQDITGLIKHEYLADLEVAHVAKDLNSIRRTKKELAQDEGDNFFLIIQEEGQALMNQHDCARILMPGDMILIDSAYASEFSFFGRFSRQVSVHLPRQEMLQRFDKLARGGIFLPKEDHSSIAVSAILSKAFQVRENVPQSHYLKEAIFGLIGSMLYERNSQDSAKHIEADVHGAQLLKRGMAYIDQHFLNPNLTIHGVAEYLNVSIRHLQRAFAIINTTPTNYLLTRRLEMACQLLAQRQTGGDGERVSTIAYNCGFNDVSNFNKQFRRAFQCSPSKYPNGEQEDKE